MLHSVHIQSVSMTWGVDVIQFNVQTTEILVLESTQNFKSESLTAFLISSHNQCKANSSSEVMVDVVSKWRYLVFNFLNSSWEHQSSHSLHWRQMEAFHSGHSQQTRQRPMGSASRLNTTCGLAAFTSCFLSCSTTELPVTTVIVTSLTWFLPRQGWNNNHLVLHNGGGGSGSFTALWSGTQMASEPEMIYSLWPNCKYFIMTPLYFVSSADVKPLKQTRCWTERLKSGSCREL